MSLLLRFRVNVMLYLPLTMFCFFPGNPVSQTSLYLSRKVALVNHPKARLWGTKELSFGSSYFQVFFGEIFLMCAFAFPFTDQSHCLDVVPDNCRCFSKPLRPLGFNLSHLKYLKIWSKIVKSSPLFPCFLSLTPTQGISAWSLNPK